MIKLFSFFYVNSIVLKFNHGDQSWNNVPNTTDTIVSNKIKYRKSPKLTSPVNS